METTHDPVHDPFTGKRRVWMSMLYGSLPLEGKIEYCEERLAENHEAHIKTSTEILKSLDQEKDGLRYKHHLH